MSQVGDAVGGFFDGLFGGGKNPIDPSISKAQQELERQQKAQIEQEKKKLEAQRIAMLRGRFSAGGGGGGAASTDAPANNDASAASLFSRITGRAE